MKKDRLNELLNVIAVDRYVNFYFRDCGSQDPQMLETIVSHTRDAQPGNYCFDIDVNAFVECEDEEQEAKVILEIINNELSQKRFKDPIPGAISIADALDKLNQRLDRPAIAVFHCFKDIYNEKEKDILRSIRTFKGMARSRFLGVLIISNRGINQWELFPESGLDERHVVSFEYQ